MVAVRVSGVKGREWAGRLGRWRPAGPLGPAGGVFLPFFLLVFFSGFVFSFLSIYFLFVFILLSFKFTFYLILK